MDKKLISKYQLGFITKIVYWFFYFLKFLPPQVFLEERVEHQIRISKLSFEERELEIKKRIFKTEAIILLYLFIYICSIFFSSYLFNTEWLKCVDLILISLRLIDIIQTNVNVSVFDSLRNTSDNKIDNKMYSLVRSIILVSYNFLEVAIIFGLYYSLIGNGVLLHNADRVGLFDKFYFSLVTQLTIGYGDITPFGFGKVLVGFQGLISYFFSIIIISRLLASLPGLKALNK